MEAIEYILKEPQTAGIVIALLWIGYMARQVKRLQDRLDLVQDRQQESRAALRSMGVLAKTDLNPEP